MISPGLPSPTAWSSTSRTGTQLGGGAGQEDLVGEVQLGAGDVALDDLEAEVARDLDRRLAVDAVEDRRRSAAA